jgi:branched-chain amino acid transport system ATP-binding protein
MLDVKDLQVFIMGMHIIKGVSIQVEKGEFVSLIGANGAGKSTLMRAIVGLQPIADGAVSLDGEQINGMRACAIAAKSISLVEEGRKLFREMSVEENLKMGAFCYRKDKERLRRNLKKCYEIFPILEKYKERAANTFSGGEQQMITISRRLMAEPRFLLIDELSLGLAPKVVTQLLDVLSQLNKSEGIGILLVEQNAAQAMKYSQRSYVMDNGRITLQGLSKCLINNQEIRKAYVGI